ncbi:unnamed protein product [Moneuplotes crassus]|uniref:Uncharacterized protein n=1 Tax=Euplotes crassus TaxID=5936 RepID=A0AAD1Y1C7_EUPCR|nr:unnamed protein product [Moneuplotes crassus]
MVDYGFLDLIFSPSSINSIVISVLWFSFEPALDIPPEGLVMMLNKMSFLQIGISNIVIFVNIVYNPSLTLKLFINSCCIMSCCSCFLN